MTEDTNTINIRPTTAVYKTFERYNYSQSTAYAEFIDNSTQSYFNHRDELEALEDFDYCSVDIHHDPVRNEIRISDNSFGMELYIPTSYGCERPEDHRICQTGGQTNQR